MLRRPDLADGARAPWTRAGFKCVEALGRIIIRGPLPTLKCYNLHALFSLKADSGFLSVWSKVQTTL